MKAFNFAPDISSMAFVEVHQAHHALVIQGVYYPRRKLPRQISMAVKVEIHGQKSDIVGNVDVTEPVVKFDTIVDRHRCRGDMNVLQMQIPVTITDPLLANTGLKQVSTAQIEVGPGLFSKAAA
jgi:hypothetical protein